MAQKPIWGKFPPRIDNSRLLIVESTSVNKFPNFFMLAGPNTLPSNNSTLQGIECSVVYITRILKHLLSQASKDSEKTPVIMPRAEAESRFNFDLQKTIQSLIYTKEVNTWYIHAKTGKNTLIWPGTQMAFWWSRCVKPIRWSDWSITV